MSKDKTYTDPRWNDPAKPKVIGHREVSDKEQKEGSEQLREHLKKIGVLKNNRE
ncbi:hypothetical protein [Paenibacillus sp. FSL K6-1230]|uniref:hypothetical protein n=1 Tax=Paenibacillus sp. FSL K6-1230 TaxID=2921603 RepID=UPI0030F8101C